MTSKSKVKNKKECSTCECVTLVTLNVTRCPNVNPKNGIIVVHATSCSHWTPAPEKWTPAAAVAYAKFRGVPYSRPTVIKTIKEHKIGRQIRKGGRWIIDKPEVFKKIIDGE